jgi:hypothetical protein
MYAENIDTNEKGIFLSVSEFLPYRVKGWSATDEWNAEADKRITRQEFICPECGALIPKDGYLGCGCAK